MKAGRPSFPSRRWEVTCTKGGTGQRRPGRFWSGTGGIVVAGLGRGRGGLSRRTGVAQVWWAAGWRWKVTSLVVAILCSGACSTDRGRLRTQSPARPAATCAMTGARCTDLAMCGHVLQWSVTWLGFLGRHTEETIQENPPGPLCFRSPEQSDRTSLHF
jgi:hypothetical protein